MARLYLLKTKTLVTHMTYYLPQVLMHQHQQNVCVLIPAANVGIGCTPSYPLEVQSGGVGTVLRAGTSFVSIDSVGSESSPSLILNGDSNTGFWHPASDTLAVSTAGTEAMRLDAAAH